MNPVTLSAPVLTEAKSEVKVPAYSVHLDTIRGCAALVVFLTHLRYIFLGSSGMSAPAMDTVHAVGQEVQKHLQEPAGIIDLGHKAVMAFFVLSGYFVGGSVVRSIQQGRWSWKKYLLQRLIRLWIVLLPALVLGFLLDSLGSRFFHDSIYTGPAGQFILVPGLADRMRGAIFLGNLFFVQTILVQQFGTNVSLWSLANEFWYYLAFPFLAMAIVGGKNALLRSVSAIALFGILFFVGGKIALYFLIWLLGLVVGLVPLRIPRRLQPVSIAVALLGLTAACMLLKYQGETNRFPVDIVISLLCLLLIYCLLHRTGATRPGFYRSGAHFVSKMSYTLYLVNLPLLFMANAILLRAPWHRWSHTPAHLLACAAIACVIFSIAYLLHLCFEAHTDKVRNWLLARI